MNQNKMEIEVQNTIDDYKEFYKFFYLKRNLSNRVLFAVFASMLFTLIISNVVIYSFLQNNFNIIAVFPIFIIVAGLMAYFRFYQPYNSAIKKLDSEVYANLFDKRKYSFLEDEILINEKKIEWKNIDVCENYDYNMYFTTATNELYILPKRFFEKETDSVMCAALVYSQSGKAKSLLPQKKFKPIYWWGVAGLMPGWGFIIGIVLVVNGATKYKDKILITIGAIDILVTILFFVFAKLFLNHP
ncbi:MAG: hypothetical protein RJA07_1089 [Bacteroidota bacterium]|jgi:hypothetical protein